MSAESRVNLPDGWLVKVNNAGQLLVAKFDPNNRLIVGCAPEAYSDSIAADALALLARDLLAAREANRDEKRLDYLERWRERSALQRYNWNNLAFVTYRPVRDQIDEMMASETPAAPEELKHG